MKRCVAGVLGSAAIALGVMFPQSASAVVVDDFEQGAEFLMQIGSGSISGTQTGTTDHIIGGHREVTLNIASTPSPGTIDFVVVDVVGGNLSLNLAASVDGMMELVWDNNGLGLGGVDLTEAGKFPGINVAFIFSDLGSDLTLIATDLSGNESALTKVTAQGPSNQFFKFDDFVPVGSTTDFTAIDLLKLQLDAPLAGDYIIDIVKSAVPNPEPATMALGSLAMGALGLATRRRRA